MREVVQTLLTSMQNAGATRVTGVQLELGISKHFTEEAVRQYFQILTQGTPIEGATLTLSWLPATYQCLSCQHRFESTAETATCPLCGYFALEVAHQDGCHIREMHMLLADEANK